MDEEQLEPLVGSGKKITLNNFFESIKSIDKVANNATKLTGQNSILIKQQTEIIESLKKTVEGIKKEVTQINAYITAQREEDKKQRAEQLRLETEAEDQKQKDEMEQRALSLKGMEETEGNSRNAPKPESKDKKDAKKEEPPGAGFLGIGAGLGIVGGVATQAFGGLTKLLGFAEGGKVNDTDNDKTNNNEDSVPAMLTPGEFVVTKDAVEKIGVDTLKGINAAAGGTNKPKLLEGTLGKGPAANLGVMSKEFLGFGEEGDMKTAEKSMRMTDEGLEKTYFDNTTDIYELSSDNEYLYSKDEMIGSGLSSETIERYNVEETYDDGSESALTGETTIKSMMVAIGIPDLIAHKNQLMSEINKLKGFEKVTFEQFMNKEHGIPQELLLPILYRSDASKATRKKMDRAEKLDRKHGVQPASAYMNPVVLGYRQNQINPTQYISSKDEMVERDKRTYKYDSAKDPTLAKGKKGVKGFSEGGLVKKDNGLSILNQLKTLADPTKSSFARKLKETADKDALGLENFAKSFSEEIGGKEGVKNIAGGVTKQVFSQFNDSISDEGGGGLVKDLINELMPQLLPEDVADMISASQDPMPLNANSPINVPQTPPNNQNVETQIPDAPFTAINLLKKMSRDNLNITVTTSNDLMSEIPEILKLIK